MAESAEDLLRGAATAALERIDRDLARANEELARMLRPRAGRPPGRLAAMPGRGHS